MADLDRTANIDLLVDPSAENIARIRTGLGVVEDRAVNDVADDDVTRYTVVRVADEILVDLMARACDVDYPTAARDALSASASTASRFRWPAWQR